ncbi:glycosyltransferase family 2 protein [Isoptericola sp. BMS4]|uniref:glycosyltransferase family 2 protein n=1 Tax=Isoptericola sp. BMS4 TaxID=2527875 RepID=UPI001F108D15|nr:glycosyltransferase family 2 protein [Isoptericola sp. BMS4]
MAEATVGRRTGTGERPTPGTGAVERSVAVFVVACVRDEEAYLAEAVASVLAQDYTGPLRLVLAVGPSHDGTARVAERLAAADERVVVVDNPTGSRSIGLNLAIERTGALRDGAPGVAGPAGEDVLLRVDGHTVLPADYVRRCVATLERTGAVAVGGLMHPVGTTPVQRAVARAMSHPAGIGAASFHVGGKAGPSETVYLGAFRRGAVEAVGGYDPSLVRAEDWELCLRLRRAGGLLWFDPALVVTYRPRRTLRAVAKQFWRTGMWRREVIRRDRTTASARYLAPPALVLGLGASAAAVAAGLLVALPALALLGAVVPLLYGLGVLAATAHAAVRRPALAPGEALVLPVVIVVMHLAWGAGFVRGLTARAVADHRA